MFKVFQSTVIVAALLLAFGAGYQMKPAKLQPATKTSTQTDDSQLISPPVDFRIPVSEMTPVASVPVDKSDLAYKWIEKELGIQTTILDRKELNSLTVLQPFDDNKVSADPKRNP